MHPELLMMVFQLSMAPPKTLKFSLCLPISILFLILQLLFSANLSSAFSITPNQSISGPQTLTSEGGTFVLGFFQPGKSPYYYIGIWYSLSMFANFTAVWVANRENPIDDPTTAELKISDDGNLILSNQSNPKIWSTNITTASKSTVAVLLDTGNLVLRDGSNPDVTLWQSMDHPTDVWLPGGKLGLNKATGEVQRLISWKSLDDPAPGIFSFGIDPNGTSQFFMLWNNSVIYWSTGTWNGKTFTFSEVPEMTENYIYDYKYVSDPQENYFTYSIKNSSNFLSKFSMDVSGQIRQLTWLPGSQEWDLFWAQPRVQCEVYALCGPFGICTENGFPSCSCIKGFVQKFPSQWALSDRTDGCTRNTELQCGRNSSVKREKDVFFTMSSMKLPDNPHSLQVLSASDCETGCLKNCSCTAYSYDSSNCSIWNGELLNLQEQYSGAGEGTLFLRLAASELGHSGANKGVVVGFIIGGIVCSSALLIVVSVLFRRRRARKGIRSKLEAEERGQLAFKYSDLQRMTKNFSEKIGGGGFGAVYKGVLPDSTCVAVKKLEGFKQGDKQFWAEVRTIGTTQHVNLVRLHGYCSEGKEKLLVYEYMPNGSLKSRLFQNNTSEVLSWETRYQIALGIAQGLTYLHEHCRECIIHCDIKPENILLDYSFVPKIADFGLAKLLERDVSRILTTMRGTIGYLAPEWISGAAITAKADVYSYGMMLFEIISGKRNLNPTEEEEKTGFFPTLAASKLIEGDLHGLLDERIVDDACLEEVTRACKAACWCIQDHVSSRPTMRQVTQILEGIVEVNMPPVPRILQILADHSGSIVFFSELSSNMGPQVEITSGSSEIRTHP